ncbi:DUF4760 domain-containing protein [Corallibacter sp.]|uniref:DUF4760 domain-containing protein n=1 Tax=Corallibacter sp. TaxID=2038084 RepID=UPI003A931141
MNKLKINFQIRYIVIFILLIIIAGVVLFFLMHKYNIDFTFTDIMAYCTGSVAIMALIYHALSLESQHKFHQENLFLTRNQYAYDVSSKFNEPHMTEALQFMSKIDSDIESYFPDRKVQKFLDYIKDNPKDRQKIITVINYFEQLSILIENGHVEEKIIKKTFKTVFISTFILMKPYIDYRQQESRTIWCNFENMSNKWNE